jgi:hypothetical protein
MRINQILTFIKNGVPLFDEFRDISTNLFENINTLMYISLYSHM